MSLTHRANGPILSLVVRAMVPAYNQGDNDMPTNEDRLIEIESDLAEIKDLLKVMYPLLVASNARGEEQSKRIDDLNRMVASLIPNKIAAVG